MCVTEIWSYRECGCEFDYFSPCFTAMQSSSILPLQQNQPSQQYPIYNSQTINPDLSSKASSFCSSEIDLEAESEIDQDLIPPTTSFIQRPCPDHQSVQKQFLEPICDECLLEELNISTRPARDSRSPAQYHEEALIFDSEVQVEICDSDDSAEYDGSEPMILDSNVEVSIEEDTDLQSSESSITSVSSSNQAADDKCSVNSRGRLGNRDMSPGRRGIDLSRQDWRVPSTAIENETSNIAESHIETQPALPTKGLHRRLAQINTRGRSWARSALKDLKNSLSQSRAGKIDIKHAETSIENSNTPIPTLEEDLETEEPSNHALSWDDHLKQDLSPTPRSRKRHPKPRASPTSAENTAQPTPSPLVSPSDVYSPSEIHRRLLSRSEAASSSTRTASSKDYVGERLSSVLTSGDFEDWYRYEAEFELG